MLYKQTIFNIFALLIVAILIAVNIIYAKFLVARYDLFTTPTPGIQAELRPDDQNQTESTSVPLKTISQATKDIALTRVYKNSPGVSPKAIQSMEVFIDNKYTEDQYLYEQATSNGISANEASLSRKLQEDIQFRGGQKVFDSFLENQQITEDLYREMIKQEITIIDYLFSLAAQRATEDTIKAHYKTLLSKGIQLPSLEESYEDVRDSLVSELMLTIREELLAER